MVEHVEISIGCDSREEWDDASCGSMMEGEIVEVSHVKAGGYEGR